VKAVLKVSEGKLDKKEKLIRDGWNLEKLAKIICDAFCVDLLDLTKKGRANNISQAKSIISYCADKELGMRRKEIAEFFGVSGQAISQSVKLGENIAKEKDIEPLCC